MTGTTRPTLKSVQSDITDLRGEVSALAGSVAALVAHLSPTEPAKPARKVTPKKAVARKAPAKKAPARKPVTRKAPAKKAALRPLSKKSRVAFVAAARKEGVDFSGLSTKAIAEYCVSEGYAPKGFVIGAGYTALFS